MLLPCHVAILSAEQQKTTQNNPKQHKTTKTKVRPTTPHTHTPNTPTSNHTTYHSFSIPSPKLQRFFSFSCRPGPSVTRTPRPQTPVPRSPHLPARLNPQCNRYNVVKSVVYLLKILQNEKKQNLPTNSTCVCSALPAHSTIPSDLNPPSLAGFRLHTTKQRRPVIIATSG